MPSTTRRVHDLKCWPEFYQPAIEGIKTFEVRVNDRGFVVGDILHLREYTPSDKAYTGRDSYFEITYILDLTNDNIHFMLFDATPTLNPNKVLVLSIKPFIFDGEIK